jgi:hypothetical protein
MTNLRRSVADCDTEPRTWTLKLDVPALLGVPEITPVGDSVSVRPGGKAWREIHV